jgi:hypothetical protein
LLLLTVASTTANGTSYEVVVRLINSASAQDSPPVSIAAIVEAGILDSPIVATDMVKTGATLISVAQGYDPRDRDFFTGNLLLRIHFVIEMIWWTGLTPWEFELTFPYLPRYDPMKTWVGNFTARSIEQSTPLVNVFNTLTVTLISDVDLAVALPFFFLLTLQP